MVQVESPKESLIDSLYKSGRITKEEFKILIDAPLEYSITTDKVTLYNDTGYSIYYDGKLIKNRENIVIKNNEDIHLDIVRPKYKSPIHKYEEFI